MHAKVFSIQIFQHFHQIPPRVCTLVLFISTGTAIREGLKVALRSACEGKSGVLWRTGIVCIFFASVVGTAEAVRDK